MFPDLARDDVFRLETARLWLRWPRASDAAAIHRYCSRWEVAQYTARIPHPYPQGSAERFIFSAREGNASGRDLTLVITTLRDKREPIGAVSLEGRAQDRLTLGYALAPEAWGKGYASEAVEAMVEAAFSLTHCVEINASVRVENPDARHVLEKVGFKFVATGPQGAPARGGLVDCDRLRSPAPIGRRDGSARRSQRKRGHEIPGSSARLYPLRRRRRRLRLVPAREVHRVRRPRRRRRRARRRRRGRMRERPQHADRLPLPAAFQGQDRHARHGQEPRGRTRRRRGAESSLGHAGVRRGNRRPARRPQSTRASASSSPRAATAVLATPISPPRPIARRAAPIPARPASSARWCCG